MILKFIQFFIFGIHLNIWVPIDASINKRHTNLDQARWRTLTIGPGRGCMQCIEQYTPEDVALEMTGLLDDPTYIKGLPKDHFINRGENVFAFSLGLAGMEMQQFLSLVLHSRGIYVGPKEYDFNTGSIDSDFPFSCKSSCTIHSNPNEGDKMNALLEHAHPIAEMKRKDAKGRDGSIKRILLAIRAILQE